MFIDFGMYDFEQYLNFGLIFGRIVTKKCDVLAQKYSDGTWRKLPPNITSLLIRI